MTLARHSEEPPPSWKEAGASIARALMKPLHYAANLMLRRSA